MKIIKEFIEFRKFLKNSQEIDITEEEKDKLRTLDSELIEKIINRTKNSFLNKCLTEDYSIEYLR
jgi:hypothetical protein